jgi:hypothetical protein
MFSQRKSLTIRLREALFRRQQKRKEFFRCRRRVLEGLVLREVAIVEATILMELFPVEEEQGWLRMSMFRSSKAKVTNGG